LIENGGGRSFRRHAR